MLKRFALQLGTVLLLILFAGQVLADSGRKLDDPSVLEAMIELLQEKGVLSEGEAAEMKGRLERDRELENAETLKTVQSETRKAAREEVTASLPSWAQRIKIGGDFRLRYQGDLFGNGNAENLLDPNSPGEVLNTTNDRHRFRYRARIGLKAALNDWSVLGFRLATGNDEDPVSTNDTFGDYFNKDNILFDQAYLKLMPTRAFTVWAGRHPNPFFSTDLVWDKDINFEGAAVNHTQQWLDNFGTFATVGAFPLQEVNDVFGSEKDKWLYGLQGGVQYEPVAGVSTKLGVAYYYFDNIEGVPYETGDVPGSKDWSAPLFLQKGNSFYDDPTYSDKYFLASEYQELNVTGIVDIGFWHPVHVVLIGDYVTNLAFDKDDLEERFPGAEIKEEVDGYMLGLAVGHPKVRDLWQWRGHLFYKYLEADAVVDAFTDSDFHLGGTNAKGWILGGELGLYRNIWLSARWLSSDEIEGPQCSVDTIQLDLNAKF